MPPWFNEESYNSIQNFVGKIPPYLYQYRSLEGERKVWIKDLITKSNLYFSKPSQFNDPLDCRISLDFTGTNLGIESYWRKYVRKMLPPNGRLRDHKANINNLVKESRTKEGQKRLSKNIFKSLDKLGILCLTETSTNMLMWSYYARGHTGVCLKFKVILENALLKKDQQIYPLKIKYTNTFPNTNYYTSDTENFIKSILGTKAKAWAHEAEWRFIINNKIGIIQSPMIQLSGIVTGMRTSKEDVESIRKWVAESGKPIELYRIENKYRTFELQLVEL